MKWDMGTVSSDPNWIVENNRNPRWTRAENKMFENALALYDKDTPDRWQKVAAMIPGKTVGDVVKQYKELEADVTNIEAGLVSVPEYSTPFTLDYWVNSSSASGYDPSKGFSGKRSSSSSGRPSEQERKKGVPWTEEEHKLFLLGLKKHGKGDWRNISRNFVLTRTPTQVASHAQKYFIRQLSGGKDKRRASIHDITTVNLTEPTSTRPTPSPPSSSSSQDIMISQQQANVNPAVSRAQFHQWNHQHHAAGGGGGGGIAMAAVTNPAHERVFMSPYGVNNGNDSSSSSSCFGFKMQGQSLHRTGLHHHPHESSYLLPPHQAQNMVFQLP